jgi:hypothetical protein
MECNRLHRSNLAQTTASILSRAKSHLDGWKTTSHKDTSQTQHHKDGKTCTTLMTAGLSKSTNHKPNPIGIYGIGNPINVGKCVTRGRKHTRSTWSRNTCLALPLAATQSLAHRAPGDSRSLQRLMVAIENKQHK